MATAALFCACQPGNKTTLEGEIEGGKSGDQIVLLKIGEKGLTPSDTIVLTDNKFSVERTVDTVDVYSFYYVNEERPFQQFFIMEPGTIKININETVKVSGTALNDKLQAFMDSTENLGIRMQQTYQELMADTLLSSEEKSQRMQVLIDEEDAYTMQTLKENNDNIIGYFLTILKAGQLKDEECEEIISAMPEELSNRPIIAKIKAELEGKKLTAVGQPFTDFTLPGINGDSIVLSDIVKNNKLTLVDFWASWCGPCRADMPEVVELYKAYHEKGLEILGVSLDNDAEAWKKAVSDMGMTWPQGSHLVSWDCPARTTYKVSAIPHTVLIDQEGKIVARELRGTELADFIKAQLDK